MNEEATDSELGGQVRPEPDVGLLPQPVDREPPPRLAFPVVGVGASAGGLEAFTALFDAMPAESGMAFVLVQHLPPDRESMVAEILQRHTAMRVSEVKDGVQVEPDHVYVIRPGHTLTIANGHLHLGDRLDRPRHSRPVDDFFRSLAEEQRERAICVILSGMGSNGAAGAQAVKAVGGLCIAQEPDSAQFPSMPRHLIDAGYADLVLLPADIPEALLAYARHPYAAARAGAEDGSAEPDAPELPQHEQQQLAAEILAIVRTRTRFDFTGYKKPTVVRRIQRRMGLSGITDVREYVKTLRRNPLEVTGLADDLLIHVTGFFRDAEAWDALRQQVIVPLVRSHEPEGSIRCWVAACSSGEEAYSLAMLLVEESELAGKRLNIKVFATDTAARTLSNARNGVYPGGIESDISPERLQRFFDREDAVYRIRQDLRERVVFAPQNILSDPPFSRLDIVTCRNLLIYLEPEVQQRVFALLHFGLRDGGTLFLGNSETVPAGAGWFEAIDKKARIYKRVGLTRHGATEFPLPRVGPREVAAATPAVVTHNAAAPSIAQLTGRALVAMHVPAAVTVDSHYRIVYYQGDTKLYLGQPSGEPTQDVLLLASEPVRGAIRTALQRSMSTQTLQRVTSGWASSEEGRRYRLVVTASPLAPGGASELFVVSFQQRDEPELAPGQLSNENEEGQAQPTEEVMRLRDELRSAVEELQASDEEHKAAAEEAMSVNEELQSTNEELETSKEEMQSLNEELSTVNSQLHAKMDELQRVTSDLRGLLASTDIAVIFLDAQFRIRRYTPAARKLLDLIGSDVGRPLNDLAKKFIDPDLLEDAESVLDHLVPAEREVRSDDGRWYARRVLPYRTTENRIDGVVITFVDISDRKRAHDVAASAGEAARGDLVAMNGLHTAAHLLAGATDMKALLEEILVAALELHSTTQGDVQLYEPVSQSLRLTVHRGVPSEAVAGWPDVNLSEPGWPVARALRERTSVAVADVEAELPATAFRATWLAAGVRAAHCIPLITRDGELLGVMTMHFQQPHRADERSLRISGLLARLGADTVERLRIEEERARLLRSEQLARRALDEAAQMKEDFLATLSHELRTPLSAIMLWSKILRNPAVGPQELANGLEAIVGSADAQARLIEDLLDSSRAAAGKLELELSQIDLVQIVRAVIEQNAPAASAKSLRIEADLSDRVGIVLADGIRIRQVVWNILANAVKFTPEGGRVSVSLARTGDEVRLTVSDTGTGITAEFLPHIFDRFRQYEAAITPKHGGLGLGLAISKQLVEMHGGSIRAESGGAGSGATFTVILPMAAAKGSSPGVPRSTPDAVAARAALAGRKVLVVEDDATTLQALGVILRQAGADVSTAVQAVQGLEVYEAVRPDIVLSDIGLPDLDGYALLRHIREIEREKQWRETPAVALSAYTREDDLKKAIDAGFSTHLGKPIDANELVLALARLA
ncbi:MAG: torS [Polyangiaceae bacterium]|jgi:two-component system CheB/CheR fusion protein|nr:torS [Polyangiaceae bacterium]